MLLHRKSEGGNMHQYDMDDGIVRAPNTVVQWYL
jgi:hypothetical protein